jgi:ATP-dependent DNA helicase RecG
MTSFMRLPTRQNVIKQRLPDFSQFHLSCPHRKTTKSRYTATALRYTTPLLAQLMYYSKDIESFGTGLRRITEACEKAHVKVEFQMLKLGFAVVFYRPDENFLTTEKMSNDPLNVPRNDLLNEMERKTLTIISENPAITADQIAVILSKSRKTVQRSLTSLQAKSVIKRVGAKKGGHWEIVSGANSADE